MKDLIILTVLILVSCSVQKAVIDTTNLNSQQIKIGEPGNGNPGKCYSKMKDTEGVIGWYEIICFSEKREYDLAYDCLNALGYELVKKNSFQTANGNALLEFQRENGLAKGGLDEATLYLLIQKTKSN